MANDVFTFQHDTTGATVYALIRDDDGQVADVAVDNAFETFADASLGDYDLVGTEQGTASRCYAFTFPSWISAGTYKVDIFEQAGGAPAVTDDLVGSGVIEWDGSAIVSQATKLIAIAGDVENLDGAAMRGTDGANTTTPPTAAENRDAILDRVLAGNHDTASTLGKLVQSITEARLAELDPANLPADIDALKGVIVEKLDDTLEDNAGTFRFTAAALAQAPTGGGGDATEAKQDSIIALLGTPTDTDIATDIAKVQTAVDAINVGTGAGARTVTVTVDDGTNPLQNATVRMTEGANTYRTTTDVNGQCTFNMDDATYTVAITKAGYSFAGSSLVVDGVETPTYSMTQISPTPSASPDQTTGYATYFDEAGDAEQSVTVFLQFVSFAASDTALAYDTKIRQATTDVNGYVEFTGLFRGAKYKVKRGAGKWVEFTAADAETTPLPVHIGKEVE